MTPATPERLRERRNRIQEHQTKLRLLEWKEQQEDIFINDLMNRKPNPGAIVWHDQPAKPWWDFL